MSSESAIDVRRISKEYLIYRRPSDRLAQAIAPRAARALNALGAKVPVPQFFTRHLALNNVSLCVPRGASVGVIGRNGSGKSTLLQIVCGTLNPTAGEVRVAGRVAALLELGSGFNPEFTGRENIYLNAAVLGMGREEIDARYRDIVAFADIGDFVEQPVKTYSTGMAMRLAFAVIAHIDADLLIIDEALAVGDAYFQQKCMRWLRSFRERGTLLFCGHDTGAVLSLCQSALWLDRGSVVMGGPAKDVAEAYGASIASQVQGLAEFVPPPARISNSAREGPAQPAANGEGALRPRAALPPPPKPEGPVLFDNVAESTSFGSGKATIVEVTMTHENGAPISFLRGGEHLVVTVRLRANEVIDSPIIGFHAKDRLGQPLFGDNTFLTYAHAPLTIDAGKEFRARFRFRLPYLATGRYSLTAACASGTLAHHVQHHWLHDALMFDVHSAFQNGVMFAIEMHIDLELDPPGGGAADRALYQRSA